MVHLAHFGQQRFFPSFAGRHVPVIHKPLSGEHSAPAASGWTHFAVLSQRDPLAHRPWFPAGTCISQVPLAWSALQGASRQSLFAQIDVFWQKPVAGNFLGENYVHFVEPAARFTSSVFDVAVRRLAGLGL